MWTARADGTVDYCNGRFSQYTGLGPQAVCERWEAMMHPSDRTEAMALWRDALDGEVPYRTEVRLRRADGAYRWHVVLALPVRDARGATVRWFGSCTDIQDQKEAERILAVVAEVTQALGSSLDPVETASTLAALVAPREAAYCEVQLYDELNVLRRAASSGDPKAYGHEEVARVARARRAGATVLTRDLSVLPVRVGESVLGWLICCDVVDDVRALVPELAVRLGVALANANAYEREHRVAMTFQRAALGPDLPDVPGVRFSALYQAAHADASIGGDWYDAFRLPDGRIVISVGDVAGSGLDAAVTMGSVRQSIRTAVLINPDPSAVVEAVDRIVRAMRPDRFVTAFVCVLDPVCGELTFANAGHPPALLRRPSGELVELGHGELPLGLRQRDSARSGVISVEPGSLLVAYTDGLTELERDPVGGYAKLLDAVRRCDSDDPAGEIFASIAAGRPPRDDIAILTVAYRGALSDVDDERRASRWLFDANDGIRAHTVRYQFLERLQDAGFGAKELAGAELVFGELIGNVFRYAGGLVDVILDISGGAPVLHVLDGGNGFEFRPRLPELYAEQGRGLFLVKAFADEFSIERRSTAGSHARAVLIGTTRVRAATPTMTRTRL